MTSKFYTPHKYHVQPDVYKLSLLYKVINTDKNINGSAVNLYPSEIKELLELNPYSIKDSEKAKLYFAYLTRNIIDYLKVEPDLIDQYIETASMGNSPAILNYFKYLKSLLNNSCSYHNTYLRLHELIMKSNILTNNNLNLNLNQFFTSNILSLTLQNVIQLVGNNLHSFLNNIRRPFQLFDPSTTFNMQKFLIGYFYPTISAHRYFNGICPNLDIVYTEDILYITDFITTDITITGYVDEYSYVFNTANEISPKILKIFNLVLAVASEDGIMGLDEFLRSNNIRLNVFKSNQDIQRLDYPENNIILENADNVESEEFYNIVTDYDNNDMFAIPTSVVNKLFNQAINNNFLRNLYNQLSASGCNPFTY